MAAESAQRLPDVLRAGRYYDAVAELAVELAALPAPASLGTPALRAQLADFTQQTKSLLDAGGVATADEAAAAQEAMQRQYRALKATVLAAGARGDVDLQDMERCLRRLSRMRRLAEQALKAAATLAALNPAGDPAVNAGRTPDFRHRA
jgi:phosphate:Na+ symporter